MIWFTLISQWFGFISDHFISWPHLFMIMKHLGRILGHHAFNILFRYCHVSPAPLAFFQLLSIQSLRQTDRRSHALTEFSLFCEMTPELL